MLLSYVYIISFDPIVKGLIMGNQVPCKIRKAKVFTHFNLTVKLIL